jgi:hypothetical protein
MFRTIRSIMFSTILGSVLISTQASAAPDYVTSVQLCGPNIIMINLKSGTSLNVWLNDSANMTQNLYDHLYAMALELLASGKQVGYYNQIGQPSLVCGQNDSIEINNLVATNNS